MTEPFVFHYAPGVGGQPQQMYITDLECACWLCGHPQLQRFYHATPLHTLTFERALALARTAHEKAEYRCENCGSAVGPESVHRAVLRMGFGDAAGELLLFTQYDPAPRPDAGPPPHPTLRALTGQLIRHRRLDPQVQPAFTPDPAHGPATTTLSRDWLEVGLSRPINLKRAVVELFQDWLDDPEGGAAEQLAPGMWCALEHTPDAAEDLLRDLLADEPDAAIDDGALLALTASAPAGIGTHAHPDAMPGAWRAWLPAHQRDALTRGDAACLFWIDLAQVVEHFEHALEVARLSWTFDEELGAYTEITTPREGQYPNPIHLLAIARRAIFTGLTPGDAARLTAEELVGLLLQVWKPVEAGHDPGLRVEVPYASRLDEPSDGEAD